MLTTPEMKAPEELVFDFVCDWSRVLSAVDDTEVVLTNLSGPLLQGMVRAREGGESNSPICVVLEPLLGRLQGDLRALSEAGRDGAYLFFHGGLDELARNLPLRFAAACIRVEEAQEIPQWLSRLRQLLRPQASVVFAPSRSDERMRSQAFAGYLPLEQGRGSLITRLNEPVPEAIAPSGNQLRSVQALLHARYLKSAEDETVPYTLVADLTQPLRDAVKPAAPVRKPTIGRWPYVDPEPMALPPTLPDGRAWPKISIVTPSFGQGRYIEETLLSVLNQGYPTVEHIVIDGGSRDQTIAILDAYRNRLAYVVSEPDGGQGHAINKGMAVATGDILTWLNSDDMLAPGALAAAALAFATSGADLVAGACSVFRDEQTVFHHITCCDDEPLPLSDILDLDAGWNAGHFFFQPEVMFTRELWERAGAYVREDLFYSADYELWLRFAEVGAHIHVVGRPICWFRMHDEQKTNVPQCFKAELSEFRRRYLSERGIEEPPKRPVLERKPALRIAMLNDIGFKYGAGIAHRRMAEAFRWAGHEVVALALSRDVVPAESECPISHQRVVEELESVAPDLVVVGNLHAARVDPWLVGEVSERWPTMVVMHDFWWLTGRCPYTAGCRQYFDGCTVSCPTADEYPKLEPALIPGAWQLKRAVLARKNAPILLAYSKWTESFARSALQTGQGALAVPPRVEPFRLGVPTQVFKPRDMGTCRARYDLPQDKFIVMVASTALSDPRKGAKDVAEALRHLDLEDLLVVVAGGTDPSVPTILPGVRQVGYLETEVEMALLYGAADVFVGASSEETFGQVFAEAAACGTPVVAYGTSGVQEAVLHGTTGLLAASDPHELAACVFELYRRPELRRAMRAWGRLYVENEFSLMRSYHSLFRVLQRTGLLDRLGVKDKIDFRPVAPDVEDARILTPSGAAWEPGNRELEMASDTQIQAHQQQVDALHEEAKALEDSLRALLRSRWRRLGVALRLSKRHPTPFGEM